MWGDLQSWKPAGFSSAQQTQTYPCAPACMVLCRHKCSVWFMVMCRPIFLFLYPCTHISIPLHKEQAFGTVTTQQNTEYSLMKLELVHRDLMSKEILCLHLRRCNIYSNKQSLGTGPQLPMPCLITLMVKKVSLSLSLRTSWRVWLHLLYLYLQTVIHDCLLLLRLKTSSSLSLSSHITPSCPTPAWWSCSKTPVGLLSRGAQGWTQFSRQISQVGPEGNNCLPQTDGYLLIHLREHSWPPSLHRHSTISVYKYTSRE